MFSPFQLKSEGENIQLSLMRRCCMKLRLWDSERVAGTASDSESFGATAPHSIQLRKNTKCNEVDRTHINQSLQLIVFFEYH